MMHSRRCFLQFAAVAAGGGRPLAVQAQSTGGASHKFSKQVAGYVERSQHGPETCGMCHYFLDPDQCVIVEGPVNPAIGWCNYGATTG